MASFTQRCAMILAAASCAVSLSAAQPAPTTAPASPTRLTLLGTGGGPIARVARSQPATLISAGGRTYLFDVGDGTPRQLVRAGLRLNQVDVVFLTHLHFDHTAGLMGFLALDWQDRRRTPVQFYGPPGTQALVHDTLHALRSGEDIFAPQLPDLPPMRTIFRAQDWDVTTAREVYADDVIRVEAVENSHYDTMHLLPADHGTNRSYSYRVTAPGRSIVITGDTGPSAAVEALARDADVLVSEVIDLPALIESIRKRSQNQALNLQPLIDHMEREHLTPENVGRMAAAARVKKLVLTHFATPPGNDTINRAYILEGIRKSYAGPVEFGEDLGNY